MKKRLYCFQIASPQERQYCTYTDWKSSEKAVLYIYRLQVLRKFVLYTDYKSSEKAAPYTDCQSSEKAVLYTDCKPSEKGVLYM